MRAFLLAHVFEILHIFFFLIKDWVGILSVENCLVVLVKVKKVFTPWPSNSFICEFIPIHIYYVNTSPQKTHTRIFTAALCIEAQLWTESPQIHRPNP